MKTTPRAFFHLAWVSVCVLLSFAGFVAAEPTYETRPIQGWTLHIQTTLLKTQGAPTEKAVKLLERQLAEIVRVVPAPAVSKLRSVPLYFSEEYAQIRPRAEYHPDSGWLRANHRDPAMAKGVEFTNIRVFEKEMGRMPNFALHELAHAYHDRFLPGGFDHPEINAAYEQAKAGGKYDRVKRYHAKGRPWTTEKAYAMTNPQEYFAETTEAYFVRNDFYPFTRTQLEKHDPAVCILLGRLWLAEK